MKLVTFLVLTAFAISTSAQTSEAYFLSQPSLSPDGQTVVFSFEGDIWKAGVNDGQASRLTGKLLTFTKPLL